MEDKKISIIGLGKLGSPMVACYASKDYKVIGVDVNSGFVRLINEGKAPVSETNLQEYLDKNKEKISATKDYREAVLNSNISFIIVPTLSQEDGDFSTEYVVSAGRKIGEALREKSDFHVVVLVSTVTPGSTERDLLSVLEESSGKKCGQDFGLCYNPEFIALGSVIYNLLNPDFILIGESDPRSGQILESFYRDTCDNNPPIKRTNIVNAELTKISLNTYVTTKISYANMLAELCEKIPGGNVDAVTDALGCDKRIGHKYLKGGVGYGGPCFPRDNRALMCTAKKFGVALPIAEATDKINHYQIPRIVNLIISLLPERGKVGILGLSYKTETNVIEESQGVEIAGILADKGIKIIAYDPAAMENAKEVLGDKISFASSLKDCLSQGDLFVLITPWAEFKGIEPADLKKENSQPIILDCWRMLDPKKFEGTAKYFSVGVNQ